jgi:LysM repeat protein
MQTAPQLSVRLALLLAAVCTVFLMIGNSAGADTPVPPPTEYVVEAGDTLWSIASQVSGPEIDLRHVVADISRISGVSNGLIVPGQVLLIPKG